jgi:hypothetical protein
MQQIKHGGYLYKDDIPGSADSGDFTEIWWNDDSIT